METVPGRMGWIVALILDYIHFLEIYMNMKVVKERNMLYSDKWHLPVSFGHEVLTQGALTPS